MTSPSDVLVDSRLGPIRRVVRLPVKPGAPRSVVTVCAEVAATERFASWRADRYAYGGAIGDEQAATRAAVGEAVERYCGNAVPPGPARASYRELRAAGRAALDPEELALYSERQYREPGFPFVPFTRDLEVAWVTGRDLHSGEPLLLPASLVYLNLHGTPAGTPATNLHLYAGIAAGETPAHARRGALEEVVERDAVTLWWLGGGPAVGIEPDASLRSLLADPDTAELAVSFLWIPAAVPVPVVGVLVEDPARRLVAFGSACRASPLEAAGKAFVEAVQLLDLQREMLDPASPHWSAVRAGLLDSHPYKPHRADRSYAAAFRADFRDMHDLGAHLQYYLDPATHGEALDSLRKPARTTPLSALPQVPAAPPERHYLDLLAARGLRALAVDLTTPDVAAAGLSVARVVVPGTYGNAPAAFPYLGGRRLRTEPLAHGWVTRPLAEEDLRLCPLPYG